MFNRLKKSELKDVVISLRLIINLPRLPVEWLLAGKVWTIVCLRIVSLIRNLLARLVDTIAGKNQILWCKNLLLCQ